MKTSSLILGRKENLKREIASLTKMMTFYTVLELARQFKLALDTYSIKVSKWAVYQSGTSANLRKGDSLTILQLLYAMMLPSGNDAAFSLAEHFGELLYQDKYLDSFDNSRTGPVTSWQFNETPVKYFLREMNQHSAKLRMFSTNFDSPHGLINKFNYSTAYDMALLTTQCMKSPVFREVVKTRIYKCSPSNHKAYIYVWENTNKLLETSTSFVGCKTGVTDTAGPCFSGCFEQSGEQICVIVLNSKSLEQRWVEVPLMAEWAVKRKQITKAMAKKASSEHYIEFPKSSNSLSC